MPAVAPEVKITSSTDGGVEQRADLFPGVVEQLVRLLGQLVNAAMDVGVVPFVAIDDRLDDLPRTLRAGGVVEIDQRHAGADRAAQDGKVGPASLDVERRRCRGRCHGDAPGRFGSRGA